MPTNIFIIQGIFNNQSFEESAAALNFTSKNKSERGDVNENLNCSKKFDYLLFICYAYSIMPWK